MKALFLSYDGMTDPLGRSQVIPYLLGLTEKGHRITLLSCEKPDRFAAHREEVAELLQKGGIDWQPTRYHKRPPIFSTIWDIFSIYRLAKKLHARQKFDLVHCRGYVTSLVGIRLKRRRGLKFVFDMRGFWPDERVDGKLWNMDKWIYRMVYRYFKRREIEFLNAADRTVCLTHAGSAEMKRWKIGARAKERIEVIPCCADLDHFDRDRVSLADRERWQKKLGLSNQDFVVTYLGSLGTWYLLEEMLLFFQVLLKKRPNAKLLFITGDTPASIFKASSVAGIPSEAIRIQEGARSEVPALLSLSDIGLFFIKPSYSKTASSPTKMAEYLGMGIPIVANAGVGDTNWLMSQFRIGSRVDGFGADELGRAVDDLKNLRDLDPKLIRASAKEYFSLEKGVGKYHSIYSSLKGEARE